MGTNESYNKGPDDIKITVESGFSGGNPRYGNTWHGSIIATIYVKRDATVASFLGTLRNIPLSRGHPRVTLELIHMGQFKPTENDLFRTVSEMGLESGILRLYNGMED